ncbi:hypothetical protein [Vibrio diabolicus]
MPQRIWQHKNGVVEGFTKKYNVHKLVYFELFDCYKPRKAAQAVEA